MKNGELSIVFSVQGTGGSPAGPGPENKVGDQDTGSPGRPVSSGLQVSSEPGHCCARTRPPWWTSRSIFPSKCPSVVPAEISNTLHWWFGPLEDNQWGGCRLDHKKWRQELFQLIFALWIFWGGVSRYAATPSIVALSLGHSDITRFRPWSPIMTENHLDRAEKIPNIAQTTGTIDVFDPCSGISGPSSWRTSACLNLHEWWTQHIHMRCPIAQLLFSRNPAVFQDKLMNLINNLRGGHCFGSSRMRCITGGKITMFKLGHPGFDGSIRWCMFPYCFCQNGVNFLWCLALQGKKTWWQLVSRCWNRARRLKCFLSASVTRKDLQLGTWTDPSFQQCYRFCPTTLGSTSG